MSKKKRKSKHATYWTQPKAKTDSLIVLTYDIVTEPLHDMRFPKVPKEIIERLHQMLQTRPKEAIPELLALIDQYPGAPVLYNYAASAYSNSGQPDKAEQMVRENFQRFPDYHFARMNYAEVLLATGDYAGVASLLDNKFDLALFYSNRKKFHISEYTSFMYVVGRYYLGIGETDSAQRVYQLMKQVAPDEATTRRLGQMLSPNALNRLMTRVLNMGKQQQFASPVAAGALSRRRAEEVARTPVPYESDLGYSWSKIA